MRRGLCFCRLANHWHVCSSLVSYSLSLCVCDVSSVSSSCHRTHPLYSPTCAQPRPRRVDHGDRGAFRRARFIGLHQAISQGGVHHEQSQAVPRRLHHPHSETQREEVAPLLHASPALPLLGGAHSGAMASAQHPRCAVQVEALRDCGVLGHHTAALHARLDGQARAMVH